MRALYQEKVPVSCPASPRALNQSGHDMLGSTTSYEMLILELVLTLPVTRFPASLGKKLDGGETAEGVGDGLHLKVIEEWPLVKWVWLEVLSVEQQTHDTFQTSQLLKISSSLFLIVLTN